MPSSPTFRRNSVRRHLLSLLLSFSLIIPLTPLGRLLSVPFIPAANAASFASGNVVVYRVGDGAAGLSANATAVFLDEYTPAGALVQSIALPTSLSGANKRLTSSGTATSEGFLSRSVDGKYIILTGYDAATGTSGIAGTTTATANRVIGRVDAAGNVDTSTALTDAFSGGNIRSATSTNGTDLWATGSNTGVRYATLGSTSSTSVSTAVTNLRQTNIFNNQLYVSSASGTTRLATVGSGTPTTTGQGITNLPGFPTSGSPYAFFFADLDNGVAGVDTVYVAEETTGGGQIQKYSLVSGSWVAKGTITAAAVRGLTGVVSGSNVTLYGTTGGSSAAGGGSLYKFTDTTGYNQNVTGTATTIATAGNNKAFRGVALAPVAGQVSTNPSGVGSANPSVVKAGDSTMLTVAVAAGTNPTSQSYTVTGNLNAIGGSSQQQFVDLQNGTFTFTATVAANITPGPKTIPITIKDDQTRTGNTSITLSVQPETLSHLVISQVYGGGGNNGTTLKNDFIELYNPTASPVNLNGWTVQYASSTGSSWQVTDLTGTLDPGQYYLIQEAQGAGGTDALPTPNATGGIAMSATTGKVALVNNSDTLSGTCPNDPEIVDFVGYGSASCFEGAGPAATLTNTTAALRNSNGNQDTDNNAADFTSGNPNPRNSAGGGGGGSEVAPFVSSTSPANNASNVLIDSNIKINFSEAVTVSGNWFNINCPTSGVHTATVTGGPTSYTLNPTTDFANSEQCTVTISASQVTDTDQNDPPDNMLADYTWKFNTISSAGVVRDPNEHLIMGNPSNAVAIADAANENNYLMMKNEYALSYNRSRAIPNWTSWHLDSSWLGSQPRTDAFRADTSLPDGWYQVNETSFSGSGFDRGHMTPSADRTFTYQENADTFLMTNMVPQAPDNNQVTWEGLESYARTLVNAGNELYIISGGYGQGGTGRNGLAMTVDQGRVVVPAYTWKVILVLPNGDNDVSRVNTQTRTIAVIMPNAQGINPDWHNYIVSVDEVEALTGYNFFSNVPEDIQAVIEANADGNTRPTANAQSVTLAEDGSKDITLTGADAENNTLTYAVASNPTHGTLSGSGANLTYTPDPDYNGADSFTFTVKDKYLTSDPATVSINVTEVNDPVTANNDSKSTPEDMTLIFPASDLTTNDSAGPNESEQTLSVTNVISTPDTHGSVALNAGQITYTPAANYNGPASFDYQVCDNGTTNGVLDAKCATATVNITIDPVNDAPTLSNVPASANINELANYTFTATANDIDVPAQTLTFSLQGEPAGATINPSTGQFNWTPTEAQGGTGTSYKFKVSVTDGLATTETEVTINVNEVNQAPTLAPIGNKTVYLGDTLSFTAVGADQDLPAQALSYSLVGTVPQGATINGTTGEFSWTPTAQQVGAIYTFSVRVTDSGNLFAEEQIGVGVAYTWSNLLAPINAGGSSTFNGGRTVPVKFALTGASSGISNATATLWLAKVTNGVAGPEFPASSTSSATTGNRFRNDGSGQYIFNWNTKGLTPGVYQLRVDMGDGVFRAVNVTLN